jgi:WD40 repeat protein
MARFACGGSVEPAVQSSKFTDDESVCMSRTNDALTPDSIFISYSRKDWHEFVEPLIQRLRAAGFSVWVDQYLIQGGEDWLDAINQAVDTCRRMILCVSSDALSSHYVKKEYRYFIDEKKLLLPLLCRDAKLPLELRGIHYLQYDNFDALVRILTEQKPPEPPLTVAPEVAISPRNVGRLKQVGEIKAEANMLWSLAFAPDSRTLASGGTEWRVRLWDIAGKRVPVVSPKRGEHILSLAFAPGNFLLAVGRSDEPIPLWDVVSDEVMLLRGHAEGTRAVTFSADGQFLASAGNDRVVRLWNVARRQQLAAFSGHQDVVNAVVISPDSRLLVSGSRDLTLRLWDIQRRWERRSFHVGDNVRALAFAPDGTVFVAGGQNGGLHLWDGTTEEACGALGEHADGVRALAFSPDSGLLASAGRDGTVRLWDMHERVQRLVLGDHPRGVYSLAFSPDGTLLAIGAGDGHIRLMGLG